MIKKIVFALPNNATTLYRMHFYTKVNGEWAMYDVGKYLGSVSTNSIEFDNIIVKLGYYTGSSLSSLKTPFTSSYGSGITLSNNTSTLTVIFKNGLKVLSGFYYGFYSYAPTKVSIYDENDLMIYEGTNLEKMVYNSATYATLFYNTKELETMKVYPTNVVGTIESKDTTQITNIYKIESITTTQVQPENTDIRYLLSFDGRNTYKTYRDGLWVTIDTANNMNEGLTKEELESLTSDDFAKGITDNKTLDILVGMTTDNENVSPSISAVKVLYLRIV